MQAIRKTLNSKHGLVEDRKSTAFLRVGLFNRQSLVPNGLERTCVRRFIDLNGFSLVR